MEFLLNFLVIFGGFILLIVLVTPIIITGIVLEDRYDGKGFIAALLFMILWLSFWFALAGTYLGG